MRLKVPSNINTRQEIWPGLTFKDGIKVVSVFVICGILAFLYVSFINSKGTVAATLSCIIVAGIVFVYYQRLDNISPADIIKMQLAYVKNQQVFPFEKGGTSK